MYSRHGENGTICLLTRTSIAFQLALDMTHVTLPNCMM